MKLAHYKCDNCGYEQPGIEIEVKDAKVKSIPPHRWVTVESWVSLPKDPNVGHDFRRRRTGEACCVNCAAAVVAKLHTDTMNEYDLLIADQKGHDG